MHAEVLGKTRSLCPSCSVELPAEIVENENAIYLRRVCPGHGEYSHRISVCSEYYKGLREYYFGVMDERFKQARYLLLVTGKCNLTCPMCFYGGRAFGEMSLVEVSQIVSNNRGAELVIFGKEPTCHGELPQIIRLLKKTQGSVSLYTNGISIVDREYLKELKRLRVDKIYLQFDGFEEGVYRDFRNTDLLEQKFKALENLRLEKMDTVINATVAKGRNEDQMKAVLEYAIRNNFVKTVNFISYARSGDGRNFLPENSTMPDELIDALERQSEGKISRPNIFLFQKLFYAYMSFFKKRTCFYIQYFWILRTSDGYLPIDQVIDLQGAEKVLDAYKALMSENGILARLYLALFLPRFLINQKSLGVIADLLRMACSHIFQWGDYSNMSSKFVQLIFSTACDPHKADFELTPRCHIGIIYKDAQGDIRQYAENGTYLLSREMSQGTRSP